MQRTDSAGVEIVVSGGSDRALDWQLTRLFELGGSDEGPESFFRVSAQRVGADGRGNLFVLDAENARVVVFDDDGTFVRSVGSRGGGPGEFKAPISLSVSPDGAVAVFDFARGSLVRFNEYGQVVAELLFPLSPPPNGRRHFEQSHDTTIVSTSTVTRDGSGLRQVLREIVDSDTLVLLTLPLPPPAMALYEQCGGGLRLPPIFAPEIAWDAQPGKVAVSSSAEYSVSVWEAGHVARIIRRDIAPMAATREQAILHLGDGFRINFGRGPCLIDPAEMVEKRGYVDAIPVIGTVLLSPSGELWLQRFTVDQEGMRPIDVFDAHGAYVGTLVRESFAPLLLLPGERVAVVEKDEFDVERLAVFAIQK
ncbi:MAG: 6-bladed beta-propeller [Gemmatimonadales bacterium]|nr:6-bladed beta-propeller [Gemmatimonadales bacterium]